MWSWAHKKCTPLERKFKSNIHMYTKRWTGATMQKYHFGALKETSRNTPLFLKVFIHKRAVCNLLWKDRFLLFRGSITDTFVILQLLQQLYFKDFRETNLLTLFAYWKTIEKLKNYWKTIVMYHLHWICEKKSLTSTKHMIDFIN